MNGMAAATADYVKYLEKYYRGKTKKTVAKKVRWVKKHAPESTKINPFKRRMDRKTAELWNWLISHHEARLGAAKAIMYRYLRAIGEQRKHNEHKQYNDHQGLKATAA